jgi:hypothetical protein
MELGITPIITSGMIIQLLQGAGFIEPRCQSLIRLSTLAVKSIPVHAPDESDETIP